MVWLVTSDASLAQYTDACVRDPAVLALRAKVYVERDETIDVSAAALHMLTKDGASRIVSVPAARGSHVRPLADREIEDKLRSLATSWCAAHNIQPLIDAVWALDRADDASLPIRLTSACSPSRTYADGVRPMELDPLPPSMGRKSSARSALALPFPLPRHRDAARCHPA
jgi:MmgE/PrpD C-terminal domain